VLEGAVALAVVAAVAASAGFAGVVVAANDVVGAGVLGLEARPPKSEVTEAGAGIVDVALISAGLSGAAVPVVVVVAVMEGCVMVEGVVGAGVVVVGGLPHENKPPVAGAVVVVVVAAGCEG
jgi:hypothetical protein